MDDADLVVCIHYRSFGLFDDFALLLGAISQKAENLVFCCDNGTNDHFNSQTKYTKMNRPNFFSEDNGKLILRVILGFVLLLHGIAKVSGGVGGIGGMLAGKGLPSFIAYGVYIGEIVAPLMMIVGYRARLGALVYVLNMIIAVLLVHMGDIFTLNDHGGWGIEFPATLIFGALAVACLGAGKYAVSSSKQWD